jgi:UDP-N-acetylmuramyl pentapeptide phosphotransferase/UDP-N-acetylglucosamine-1-phosphate transferase
LDWFAELLPFILLFLVIFGYYNYRPRAKTFLGDAGSISLGLIAACLVIFLIKKTDDYGFIVLLSVYGVDSVGTIILRIIRRENIFVAHRSHLYQDMTNIAGHTHLKVAVGYAITQLIINVIWIVNFNYQIIQSGILLLMIFIPSIAFYLWYKTKHKQKF